MVRAVEPECAGAWVDADLRGQGASAARTWLAGSDRRLSVIGGAGGIALIGLGLTVAVTRH